MGSSCAAGFDRYWRSLGRHYPGENLAIQALNRPIKPSETGTGRAQAGTTKSFPTAFGALSNKHK
jgi:hypothetical protein